MMFVAKIFYTVLMDNDLITQPENNKPLQASELPPTTSETPPSSEPISEPLPEPPPAPPVTEQPIVEPAPAQPQEPFEPEPMPQSSPRKQDPAPEITAPLSAQPQTSVNLPKPTDPTPPPLQAPDETIVDQPKPTPQPKPEGSNTPPMPAPPPATRTPIDINTLTPEELKAAAALWAKQNQRTLSQKGVQKRRAVAEENIHNIAQFVTKHSPANNRTISRALNLPPRRVQHYMQLLTKRGVISASGWGISREYHKK